MSVARTRRPEVPRSSVALALIAMVAVTACSGVTPGDKAPGPFSHLQPLSKVPVPAMSAPDIRDLDAAVRLGKAFFWDVQVGSDGVTACATCHFSAGGDDRPALNPGPNGKFDEIVGGSTYAPGRPLSFRTLKTDDAFGSTGVVRGTFHASPAGSDADDCTPDGTTTFGLERQVTAFNSPPASGSLFYTKQFWDGRASDIFNGAEPTGGANGDGLPVVTGAALASQSVGPVVNDVEMACSGRPLAGLNSMAARLLARAPLARQVVDPKDSVLGGWAARGGEFGLSCGDAACSYTAMIDAAFSPEVASRKLELFGRIWGLAIAVYERTLIPDATPFDRYLSGDRDALSPEQLRGLEVFSGDAGCAECHAGSELSDATFSFAALNGPLNRDGADQGFHNIGVRPTAENLGRAAVSANPSAFNRGAFKTPGLRNVGLTAPYFHDGRVATLEEVVQFYTRGGDFPNAELSTLMKPVPLSATDQQALVALMRDGLTDCRVRQGSAPFDHPSLPLPGGRVVAATGAGGNGPCN